MTAQLVLDALWESVATIVRSAPVQVLTAVIAFASFYRTFLQGPRFQIIPADTVRLVLGTGDGITALHVMCTLVNQGGRPGVLQRLEAEVTPPGIPTVTFVWREFYKYLEGGESFQKETDPHPVALAPRQDRVLFVEFGTANGDHCFDWQHGRYSVELRGWVGKTSRSRQANVRAKFSFYVSAMEATDFQDTFHARPTVRRFAVDAWRALPVNDPFAEAESRPTKA